jgi:hypothetical protein
MQIAELNAPNAALAVSSSNRLEDSIWIRTSLAFDIRKQAADPARGGHNRERDRSDHVGN